MPNKPDPDEPNSSSNNSLPCAVVCEPASDWINEAKALADKLHLPYLVAGYADIERTHTFLTLSDTGLGLQLNGSDAKPVHVDFVSGRLDYRRKQGGGFKDDLAKAVGVKSGTSLKVLDCTAGWGRDAFLLAALGCRVDMLEKNPIMHALLADGLARGKRDKEVAVIIERMQLHQAEAEEYITGLNARLHYDVAYLDPMFPERSKKALVKKEMQVLHALLGSEEETSLLLSQALKIAKRVVVKRPRKAPTLDESTPVHHSLLGKANRYDVYITQHRLSE